MKQVYAVSKASLRSGTGSDDALLMSGCLILSCFDRKSVKEAEMAAFVALTKVLNGSQTLHCCLALPNHMAKSTYSMKFAIIVVCLCTVCRIQALQLAYYALRLVPHS